MQDIEELKRQGLSIRAISGLTGYDRKTIRKYLIQPESAPVYGPRPAAPSKLDAFKPYLDERLLTNSYLVGAQNWAQLTLTAAQP